jgi:hypothetical protein
MWASLPDTQRISQIDSYSKTINIDDIDLSGPILEVSLSRGEIS